MAEELTIIFIILQASIIIIVMKPHYHFYLQLEGGGGEAQLVINGDRNRTEIMYVFHSIQKLIPDKLLDHFVVYVDHIRIIYQIIWQNIWPKIH